MPYRTDLLWSVYNAAEQRTRQLTHTLVSSYSFFPGSRSENFVFLRNVSSWKRSSNVQYCHAASSKLSKPTSSPELTLVVFILYISSLLPGLLHRSLSRPSSIVWFGVRQRAVKAILFARQVRLHWNPSSIHSTWILIACLCMCLETRYWLVC